MRSIIEIVIGASTRGDVREALDTAASEAGGYRVKGPGDPREELSRCSRPLEDLVLVRIAASVAGPVNAHGVLSALIWRHRGKWPMPHAWMAAASCHQL